MSRWYGSVQNRISEGCAQPTPEVGMGVTEMLWSDRSPYIIVEVKDERHITVEPLGWKRTDNNGFSEWQEYEYFRREDAPKVRLFKTKEGRWRERIGRNGLGDNTFVIGYAERYYDPSF